MARWKLGGCFSWFETDIFAAHILCICGKATIDILQGVDSPKEASCPACGRQYRVRRILESKPKEA